MYIYVYIYICIYIYIYIHIYRSDPGPRRDLEEISSPQRSRSQSFEGLEKLVCIYIYIV